MDRREVSLYYPRLSFLTPGGWQLVVSVRIERFPSAKDVIKTGFVTRWIHWQIKNINICYSGV